MNPIELGMEKKFRNLNEIGYKIYDLLTSKNHKNKKSNTKDF